MMPIMLNSFNPKSLGKTFTDLLFLVPVSAFFLVFKLGNGSLASWDEAIYAGVAKEIFLSKDWLHLTWAGQAWIDKPPLSIWATAFFYKLFGVSEFSARLFSALCGVGIVVMTYLIGRKLLNRWVGFTGAMVLLSSSHFLRFSRFGMMDAPVTLFLCLALYFFWLGREKDRYLVFFGLAAGFGFLTKSFAIAFVFPIVGFYAWWADELVLLKRPAFWAGLGVFLVMAVGWTGYQAAHYGQAYLDEALYKHFFLRSSQALEGHAGNYYFYIRTMVNKYHPWILVGVFSAPFFLFKAIKDRLEEIIYLSLWMFVIFIIVTLMKTKLPWYIFPAYPALSLSVAYVSGRLLDEKYSGGVKLLFLGILALHVHYSHVFNQDYSRPIKNIAPAIESKTNAQDILYLYHYHEAPASNFYLGRQTRYLDDENALISAAKNPPGRFLCLMFDKEAMPMSARLTELGIHETARSGDYALYEK